MIIQLIVKSINLNVGGFSIRNRYAQRGYKHIPFEKFLHIHIYILYLVSFFYPFYVSSFFLELSKHFKA